jgi:hypothetical protein
MAKLTNAFLKEAGSRKVNLGNDYIITNITDKNIMLKQISKISRGNCGTGNSGRVRFQNTEESTEWFLKNKI